MKNHGVQNGLIIGGISVAFMILFYFLNPKLLFNTGLQSVLGIAVPAYFMYKASVNTRTDQGGLISFGEALTPAFLAYLIGSFLAILFTYILYNFIDPQLLVLQGEMALEMSNSIMDFMGADLSSEEKSKIQEEMLVQASQFGLSTALFGWLFSLIFPGIIIALIAAAIVKRNPEV